MLFPDNRQIKNEAGQKKSRTICRARVERKKIKDRGRRSRNKKKKK